MEEKEIPVLLSKSEPYERTMYSRKYYYDGMAVDLEWLVNGVVRPQTVMVSLHRQRIKDTSKYSPKECNKKGNR